MKKQKDIENRKCSKATCFILLIVSFLLANVTYAGQNIEVRVDGGMLYGTLEAPAGDAPCPAVVIIAGSGPTDRDGNNPLTGGKNNSLKLLAESLVSNGIASVRYDKRGIGESSQAMTREEDLCFETYIYDAVMWGKELRKNKRFTEVAVIGHSEGSLIGMIACRKMGADAFVSIAGVGCPAAQLIVSQLQSGLPEDLFDDAVSIVDRLNRGETVDTVPPSLDILFRTSVQPYLISWFKYNPAGELAKLRIPILIINGSSDIQVGVDNAEMLAKSNKLAGLVVIEGMNHVLKKVSGDIREQISSYGDPRLPVAEELTSCIADFIMSAGKTRSN
jgi:hypothetical protein